jgi:hypothetical protein
VDRAAVVAAVEKYLASRGIGVAAGAPAAASSCGCSTPAAARESTIANVAAEVVDRILAGRGTSPDTGGYS